LEPADVVPRDAADEAMVARAHERFAAERRGARRRMRQQRPGRLPNLVVIGGLKCGTTSLHHYLNLHPAVEMSRPKELNFFVAELNWPLGAEWYASHFSGAASIRGESSPHYTSRPRFEGVAERMRSVLGDARLVYMVRDPIDRMLSHYLHNAGGGYEHRTLADALADPESAYVSRSLYAFQLEPYLEHFGRERIEIVAREELKNTRAETMRRLFAFLGVNSGFTSEQFEREWETGTAKARGRFRIMDRAVRLPGLRALDRNFDRLPESLRWLVERVVHDPDAGAAPKPEIPPALRQQLASLFRDDIARLERIAGRGFGWLD
jgi:Sulfotransferase domain